MSRRIPSRIDRRGSASPRARTRGSSVRVRRAWAVALALVVLVAGCTGSDTDADGPADGPADERPAAEAEAADTDPAVDASEPDGDDDEPPPQADDRPPRMPFPLPEIELTSPGTGVGSRPELAWEPVDGAATYSLTVYAPSGVAYWAWHGTGTSVVVGGVRHGEVADTGPRVVDGMTWDVIAVDGDGMPLARSVERPLSP